MPSILKKGFQFIYSEIGIFCFKILSFKFYLHILVRDWIYQWVTARQYTTNEFWPMISAATSLGSKPQPLQQSTQNIHDFVNVFQLSYFWPLTPIRINESQICIPNILWDSVNCSFSEYFSSLQHLNPATLLHLPGEGKQ